MPKHRINQPVNRLDSQPQLSFSLFTPQFLGRNIPDYGTNESLPIDSDFCGSNFNMLLFAILGCLNGFKKMLASRVRLECLKRFWCKASPVFLNERFVVKRDRLSNKFMFIVPQPAAMGLISIDNDALFIRKCNRVWDLIDHVPKLHEGFVFNLGLGDVFD